MAGSWVKGEVEAPGRRGAQGPTSIVLEKMGGDVINMGPERVG